MHLSTLIFERSGKSDSHLFHLVSSSSPIALSQASFSLHKSCSSFLAGRMAGAKNPRTELVTDSISRRVVGLSLGRNVRHNWSVYTSHCIPRVRSTGSSSLSKSRSRIEEALSLSGMVSITSFLLLSHLVSRNPPLQRSSRSCWDKVVATLMLLTDFRQSST